MAMIHNKSIAFFVFCLIITVYCGLAIAGTEQLNTDKQYHERISQLWNQKKGKYYEMMKRSDVTPYNLYTIQAETNNLLKYSGYCHKYSLLDELCGLYLLSTDTLTTTDQYVYYYYPDRQKRSVQKLDKKYRMWIGKQNDDGDESILVSSQFLYLLSETVNIISDIKKENHTSSMKEALSKFVPMLIEHYNRWINNKPGPFQVRAWGCSFDGQYVASGMNHMELINKKLEKKLGNGKSPQYCNAVTDTDLWIIAGVANILNVHKKDKSLIPITQDEHSKLLAYLKTGLMLLESRFKYERLTNFEGKSVEGAIFDAGMWSEHRDYEYSGYRGHEYPIISESDKLKYRRSNVGWDLSHSRRFVYVFDTLIKSRDLLQTNFPKNDLLEKMANQLVYAAFNRDFKKPLFSNFMDGTNGWYRVGYEGRKGFGYGPGDMSLSVLTGGYGFWSKYNSDLENMFSSLIGMIKENDPDIRKHVLEHYETTHWNQKKRGPRTDLKKHDNPETQSILIQILPSMCFMKISIDGL